jgi:hypothetical protein
MQVGGPEAPEDPELSEAREAALRRPQVAVDEERSQLSRDDVSR